MQIKRVRVWSAAKVCGVLGAFVGVLVAGVAGLVSVISGDFYRGLNSSGALSLGTRVGLVMAFPFVYAGLGLVGGALHAVIYNLVAEFFGGIEVDLEDDLTPPAE
jgi:hypothetical protein